MHTPSFNTWTIVFAIAAAQALFTAVVLLRWRRGSKKGNQLLAAILTLFGLTLIEYVMFWTGYMYQYPMVSDISVHFPFLFGPLLWFYIQHIYRNDLPFKKALLHILPFFAGIVCWLPWYLLPVSEKMAIQGGAGQFPLSRMTIAVFTWGRILHLLVYNFLIFRFIYRQPRVGQTWKWSVWLGVFFSGFTAAYTSYYVLSQFAFFNLTWDYHISATMTAFIYLIATAGYTQEAVFEGFDWKESASFLKYKNSGLTPEASRSLLEKLQQLMTDAAIYRQPELSLEQLSNLLNASKHHVSQVINEHTGMSFFEYINQLRISKAREMLESTNKQQMNVIEIAYAVGFNNKVSFNTAFKKITGLTPTVYRKNHHRSDPGQDGPSASKTGPASTESPDQTLPN